MCMVECRQNSATQEGEFLSLREYSSLVVLLKPSRVKKHWGSCHSMSIAWHWPLDGFRSQEKVKEQ